MMPMLTSGCPIFALSEAIRRSQARASSAPPPRAKPLIAARIGLLHAAIASPSRRPRSEKERISRADSPTISLMSAPATKARSPAPVRMIAPTSAAIDRCSIVMSNSCKTRELRAFSASGRLIVTTARRSSISVLITPGMESSGPASGRSGMNVRRSEPAGSYPNRYCAHPGGWMHSSGRGFAVGVVILLVLTFGFLAEPARAATNRPTWSTGDFWVYSYSAAALNQTASGSPTRCGRHGIRHAQRDVVFGLQSPGHGQLRIRELDDDFQRRPVVHHGPGHRRNLVRHHSLRLLDRHDLGESPATHQLAPDQRRLVGFLDGRHSQGDRAERHGDVDVHEVVHDLQRAGGHQRHGPRGDLHRDAGQGDDGGFDELHDQLLVAPGRELGPELGLQWRRQQPSGGY